MKRLLLSIVAALTLSLGLVSLPAEEASAHNWDNYSLYYCAKHADGWAIIHSTPDWLSSTHIRYYCRRGFFGIQEQYWVVVELPLNSDISWRPWDYQRCWPSPGYIVYCTEPA